MSQFQTDPLPSSGALFSAGRLKQSVRRTSIRVQVNLAGDVELFNWEEVATMKSANSLTIVILTLGAPLGAQWLLKSTDERDSAHATASRISPLRRPASQRPPRFLRRVDKNVAQV